MLLDQTGEERGSQRVNPDRPRGGLLEKMSEKAKNVVVMEASTWTGGRGGGSGGEGDGMCSWSEGQKP